MAERWAGARLLRLWGGGCAFREVKKIACNEPGTIAGEKMQRMAISNRLLGAYLCRACSGGTNTCEKNHYYYCRTHWKWHSKYQPVHRAEAPQFFL